MGYRFSGGLWDCVGGSTTRGSNGLSVLWWIVALCRWRNVPGGAMRYRVSGLLAQRDDCRFCQQFD